ncbi:hypothetical protein V3481_006985 [Fusarium oxysporum f. sp. vasinfectum]
MIKIGRPLPPKSNTNPRPSKRPKTTSTHPSHESHHHPSTSPSLTPVVNHTPSSPPPSPSKPAKSPKPSPQTFTEVDSLRKQAEPYRLAVAELPIHLLHSSWSRGSNRPLDRNHIKRVSRDRVGRIVNVLVKFEGRPENTIKNQLKINHGKR